MIRDIGLDGYHTMNLLCSSTSNKDFKVILHSERERACHLTVMGFMSLPEGLHKMTVFYFFNE